MAATIKEYPETESGGGDLTVTTVSSGTTYSAATYNTFYIVNVGNQVEVDLPTASGQAGKTIDVVAIQGSDYEVTIDPNGSETISGMNGVVLSADYASVSVISDGTSWVIK